MTPETIRKFALHYQHLNTLKRHGVSVQRLSELFKEVDRVWPRIAKLEATEGLQILQKEGLMNKAEAICAVQLYGVIKEKQIELSN